MSDNEEEKKVADGEEPAPAEDGKKPEDADGEAKNAPAGDESDSGKSDKKPDDDKKPDNDASRKLISALGYIIWILFFLPLVAYPNDAEAKRRANEQLNMLIIGVAGNVLFGVLTAILAGGPAGLIFFLLVALFDVAMLALGVVGIVYTVTDKDTPLPVVSAFSLIK